MDFVTTKVWRRLTVAKTPTYYSVPVARLLIQLSQVFLMLMTWATTNALSSGCAKQLRHEWSLLFQLSNKIMLTSVTISLQTISGGTAFKWITNFTRKARVSLAHNLSTATNISKTTNPFFSFSSESHIYCTSATVCNLFSTAGISQSCSYCLLLPFRK